MTGIAGAAAIATALVLAVAAVAKVRDLAGTTASFTALHLRAPRVLARAVPAVELLVAVAVLVRPSIAAWVALALFVAFTGVLARAVVRGLDARCACFGSARREPVSYVDLVRNVLLIALATVASGATSATEADLPGMLVAAGAVTIGRLFLAVLDMRRRVGPVWSTTLPGERR